MHHSPACIYNFAFKIIKLDVHVHLLYFIQNMPLFIKMDYTFKSRTLWCFDLFSHNINKSVYCTKKKISFRIRPAESSGVFGFFTIILTKFWSTSTSLLKENKFALYVADRLLMNLRKGVMWGKGRCGGELIWLNLPLLLPSPPLPRSITKTFRNRCAPVVDLYALFENLAPPLFDPTLRHWRPLII